MKKKWDIGIWLLVFGFGIIVFGGEHGGKVHHSAAYCAKVYAECIKGCDNNSSCINKCAEDEAHCRGMY